MQKSAVMPTRVMKSFQLAAKNSRFLVTFYRCDHHPLTLAVHWIFSGKNGIQVPSAMYLMEKQAIWLTSKKECEPKRTKTRTCFTEAKKRPLDFISRSFPGLGIIHTM